jgi:hypothetical protein
MKPDINAIIAYRFKRLQQDRFEAAKRIAFLTKAKEDEIRRAAAIKYSYLQEKNKLLKK